MGLPVRPVRPRRRLVGLYTWMYNGTGGSLLIVVLFHAASNLPLTVLLEPLQGQVLQPFWIYVGC